MIGINNERKSNNKKKHTRELYRRAASIQCDIYLCMITGINSNTYATVLRLPFYTVRLVVDSHIMLALFFIKELWALLLHSRFSYFARHCFFFFSFSVRYIHYMHAYTCILYCQVKRMCRLNKTKKLYIYFAKWSEYNKTANAEHSFMARLRRQWK